MVRVTNRMMVDSAISRVQRGQERLNAARDTVASGRAVNRPSDDPIAAGRIMRLRADLRAREQEMRNVGDAEALVNQADGALANARRRMHRVRDLLVQGASDQPTPSAREAIAQEVAQIRDELVAIANTKHDGRPIFGGFTAGDPVTGGGGTWDYNGDAGEVRRRIGPDQSVKINVTAEEVFGPFNGTDDVFTLLDTIVGQLQAQDQAGLQGSLASFDTALERVGTAQGTIGAAASHIEQAEIRLNNDMLTIRGELSVTEDADMTEAIMELQVQEMSYEATLAALGRSLPQSLVSFLR